MLTTTAPAPDPQSQNAFKSDAEVLVWIGTAYGRMRVASAAASPAPSPAPTREAEPPARSTASKVPLHRHWMGAVAVLALALPALYARQGQRQLPPPAEPAITSTAVRTESDLPPQGPSATRQAAEGLATAASGVAASAAAENDLLPLASGADDAAALATPEASSQPLAPPAALPEQIAIASVAAPAPLPAVLPEPVKVAEVVSMPTAIEAAAPSQVAGYAAGNPDILEGQKHFAKGELAAARRAFEKALKGGLPEGALALGTTYDPVSLAKSGITSAGDAERARHWYRHAYDLAIRTRQGRD